MKNFFIVTLTFVVFTAILIFFSFVISAAEPRIPTLKDLHPYKIDKPPIIDGVLDEEVWQKEPTIDDIFITVDPSYGEILSQKTRVWIAYDPDNIYFAFYCYDNEPEKIKTAVSRRDNSFSDDYIGLIIDTFGNRQNAYELLINPNGIQMDALRTGNSEDMSSDWVWYSAGKIVSDGYIVEVHMPLKNFRYTNGDNVEMGIVFGRKISRTGTTGVWPDIPPGKGVLTCSAKLIFENLNSQLKLEALPAVTYGSIWDRQDPEHWSDADDKFDVGVSLKYGLTSTTTLEATINPDFSQVESDSFQVIVNQRYPIFYDEKRPFFMEAGNLFNLAATMGDVNMYTAVHTRTIVDPAWGARLTGELRGWSFGLLAAGDEWPGRNFGDDEVNPFEGKNANFYIGRAKFSLGGENYIGTIYSGRELGDDYNRVIGGDMKFYFGGNHIFSANYLYSFSNDSTDVGKTDGSELTLFYTFDSKPLGMELIFEDYSKDFRMDTAFYQRNGFSRLSGYFGPSFYPDEEKLPWLKRINPFVFGWYGYDKYVDVNDLFLMFGLRFYTTKQGYLRIDYYLYDEPWVNDTYHQERIRFQGGAQFANWLYLEGYFSFGDLLYYDKEDPFLGKGISWYVSAVLQPTENLTQSFTYIYQNFDRASDKERIYDVNIFRSRTTYQFNEYFFIRAIFQYDSYLDVLLTDLLASFTLIPGTVMHLGYGSLHEGLEWKNNGWESGTNLTELYQTRQSIFFKASYLFQL